MRLPRPARLLPAFALLLGGTAALAQQTLPLAPVKTDLTTAAFVDGPVGLTPAQASTFKDALAALAAQGHICIIAEDAPLHSSRTPDKAPAVVDHTPLSAAVTLVADAYDYEAVRTGNVFTLTKRYTDPADLPDVTPEECAADMHNVVLALQVFDPPAVWGGPTYSDPFRDRIAAILGALPPDQFRAVFSEQGLPIAHLGPAARAATDRWDLGLYLDDDLTTAQRYEIAVAHADQAAVGVSTTPLVDAGPGRPPLGGESVFGRRALDGEGGLSFQSFDDPPYTTGITTAAGWGVTPGQLAAARARAAGRKTDGRESLARAVGALAGRGLRCAVAPALAAKSVTAAGEANAAPGAALAGLARVYGLRVHTRAGDGVTVLDLPERASPLGVADVWRAVRGLVPDPLLRASHLLGGGAPGGLLAQLRQRESALTGPVYNMDDFQAQLASERAVREEPYAAHRAGVWALRVASELYPASAKVNGLLPVSAMTADDRALYAAAVMLPFLNQVKELARTETVKPLTEEDQYVLTAKVYASPDERGTWKVNLDMNRPRADGTLDNQVGMGQVAYAGPPPPPGAISAEDANPSAP